MPELCRFNGLVIKMYLFYKEHNPPHVHVIYGGDYASIKIDDGSLLDGSLPPKQLIQCRDWVLKNKRLLNEMWKTQRFIRLDKLN